MSTIDVTLDGPVRRIEIRRPPLNVLTMATMNELTAALGETGDGERLVVLTGTPHFSAGADVGEHLPPQGRDMLDAFDRVIEALEVVPVPTLAVVRGACLGGGFELAIACDLMIVAENAKLGVPEIRLGVFPPVACALLPERIGPTRTRDLVFSGREIDGKTALEWGLASRVAPEADLDRLAGEWIDRLAALSGQALRAAKRAVRGDRADRLVHAGAVYRQDTLTSADGIEGLTAFLEKRKPVWAGS